MAACGNEIESNPAVLVRKVLWNRELKRKSSCETAGSHHVHHSFVHGSIDMQLKHTETL